MVLVTRVGSICTVFRSEKTNHAVGCITATMDCRLYDSYDLFLLILLYDYDSMTCNNKQIYIHNYIIVCSRFDILYLPFIV